MQQTGLKLIKIAVASTVGVIALTGCVEVPKNKQTLKRHKITYSVSHNTKSRLEIEYGYQTKSGDTFEYKASRTSPGHWQKKQTTAKRRVEYVGIDVTSYGSNGLINHSDKVSCRIVFDGKTLIRKSGYGTVTC